MTNSGYRKGDHWVIDDVTGLKVRASRTVKQWDGSIVDRKHAINLTRHPQEFQKLVNEKQSVDNPRPRTVDVFIGPLQTMTEQSSEAGSHYLDLVSSTRFEAGDTIGVMLANMDHWRTRILRVYANFIGDTSAAFSEHAFSEDAEVTELTDVLELVDPLPWGVDAGAVVVNYTALALSDLAA